MKARLLIVSCLLVVLALYLSFGATAQEQEPKPKSEKFGALAYMPHGAGMAMVGAGARVNVDLYVRSYTSDADAKSLAGALLEGGSESLLKALEKRKSIGKITLTGRTGFYDLKLIRSHKTPEGRRIYAVGDRPMGFLEVYAGNRSEDYPFGILQLDLKKNSKGREEGTGALIYAAKIKVLDGNSIDIESYGIDAIRLMGVRKL
ncbi:MAG TPA: hypothetical protein VJT69_16390 [Pyrinomonadaceae bacterium]|nr:hypothetical protein [Pyrinomonadaceae bacterium]